MAPHMQAYNLKRVMDISGIRPLIAALRAVLVPSVVFHADAGLAGSEMPPGYTQVRPRTVNRDESTSVDQTGSKLAQPDGPPTVLTRAEAFAFPYSGGP